ncbi:MAG TPA: DNA mismatch repair protein MutS, partial [Xanthobacteraceae bacterium]
MDAALPRDPDLAAAAADPAARVTPMMEQYIEIKAANPGSLLFYRMGDFYELFFDDAEAASRALGIVLTKRGKHLGRDIPMCGVPIERADEYLHKLIALGHRVAVCEQLEDPAEARKRGNKSVVKRDVVRLVTPGTLTEDTLLDARRNNYLAAVVRARTSSPGQPATFAIGWIDISTGEFGVAERDEVALAAEIARLAPGEIIVSDALFEQPESAGYWRSLPAVTPLGRDVFDGATAERRLADYFGVATTAGFGPLSRLELAAAAACITYVERTQIGKRPPLSPPARERAGATLQIDAATRANLELMATLAGERRGSLLAAIDRTVTAAGGRLLAQRLAAPLTDPDTIRHRLDAVAAFVQAATTRGGVRKQLAACPDFARSLARLTLGRGGPRDLSAIRDGLDAAQAIASAFDGWLDVPAEIAAARAALAAVDAGLAQELARALADELPAFKRDGGFIRTDFSADLDALRALRDESRRVIASLQAGYAEESGVKSLKIRHNNVLGYFIEVTAQHADKLLAPPLNARFIHRQTLAGQVRFTTTELAELEAKIATAAERALALELEQFEALAAQVIAASEPIKAAAQALATLDVAAGLALLAAAHDYVRPEVADGLDFVIDGGRHPVVEQALQVEG